MIMQIATPAQVEAYLAFTNNPTNSGLQQYINNQ